MTGELTSDIRLPFASRKLLTKIESITIDRHRRYQARMASLLLADPQSENAVKLMNDAACRQIDEYHARQKTLEASMPTVEPEPTK